MAIERISLYLNDENKEDRVILDFLNQKSKKGPFAKESLYNYIIGNNLIIKDQIETVKNLDDDFSALLNDSSILP